MTLAEKAEVALLTLCGAAVGILAVAFLPLYLGPVPFPVSAIIAGGVNYLLLRQATRYTESFARYLPLVAWALVVIVAMSGALGNTVVLIDFRAALLLLCGLLVPVAAVSYGHLRSLGG